MYTKILNKGVVIMKKNLLIKLTLSLGVIGGSVAGPTLIADNISHAEQSQSQNQIGNLTQKSDSTLHLTFNKNVKANADENGVLTISDGKNSETLPVKAKDKNGEEVTLAYKKVGDGYDVQVMKSSQDRNWAKCALGTAGGAGGGGLAGGAAGTAIPGIGNVAGTVIGGVSGAATGAAASCFD